MINSKLIYDFYNVKFGDIFGLAKINGFKIYEENFKEYNGRLVLGGIKISNNKKSIFLNRKTSDKVKNFMISYFLSYYFLENKSKTNFEYVKLWREDLFSLNNNTTILAVNLLIDKDVLKNEFHQYRLAIKNSKILNGITSDVEIVKSLSDKYLIPYSILMRILEK